MININFKPGVQLYTPTVGINPMTLKAMVVASEIYNRYGSVLTVTSVFDGKHMKGSKHYRGLAFDCRTNCLSDKQLESIYKDLTASLHPTYDVILEKDHFHIETH